MEMVAFFKTRHFSQAHTVWMREQSLTGILYNIHILDNSERKRMIRVALYLVGKPSYITSTNLLIIIYSFFSIFVLWYGLG